MDIQSLNAELVFDDNFKHISYEEKIRRGYEELINTNPSDIIKWGWQAWDDMMGGIFGGKIYLVGAISGHGKSSFVNQICRNVSHTGFRVAKYSLEDRMEDIAKEEIYYLANRHRYKAGKPMYSRPDFLCNKYYEDPNKREEFTHYINLAINDLKKLNIVELDKKKTVTIDDMVRLIEEEASKGTKLVVIDHLHYFAWSSRDRKDIQITNAMHDINEVARKQNIAIILVAHYKKNVDVYSDPDLSMFKDGSAIVQVSNVVIQLERDFKENKTKFHFTKLRGPIKPEVLETTFNLKTFEYDFKKSSEQIKRERRYVG